MMAVLFVLSLLVASLILPMIMYGDKVRHMLMVAAISATLFVASWLVQR